MDDRAEHTLSKFTHDTEVGGQCSITFLMHQKVMLSFRENSMGSRNGLMETL